MDTDRRCFAEVILHGIERKGHVSGSSSKEHCGALALLLSQGAGWWDPGSVPPSDIRATWGRSNGAWKRTPGKPLYPGREAAHTPLPSALFVWRRS